MIEDPQLYIFILIGFFAQLVDGTLGMGYGMINMTFLLSLGVPPAIASASVHSAEVVTTGISGLSHAMFKNVHKNLFLSIVIPGVIGSVLGAYVLTTLTVDFIKPGIAIYLFILGCMIFAKSFVAHPLHKLFHPHSELPERTKNISVPIGFIGGFFDSLGGGGWGAIVTSSLMMNGTPPRYTIGSVNLAEFLVAIASSATFYMTIGFQNWTIFLGLIIGGAIAAPWGGYFAKHIKSKFLMRCVSVIVIITSLRLLFTYFMN